MYRLPPEFDGRAFVGQVLSGITFTPNTVHLAFGPDLLLTLLSTYSYRLPGGGVGRTERVPATETAMLGLIGMRVTDSAVSDGRNLILQFGNGGAFTCLDDSDQYESYAIKIGDKEITV